MPRLIDADALDDVLREEYLSATDASMVLTPRGSIIFNVVLDRVRCIAISQPIIDAEPVRHGRWMPVTCENHPKIILGCTGYMCSECGRIEEENSEPYCHCGAKMDGGDPHD